MKVDDRSALRRLNDRDRALGDDGHVGLVPLPLLPPWLTMATLVSLTLTVTLLLPAAKAGVAKAQQATAARASFFIGFLAIMSENGSFSRR